MKVIRSSYHYFALLLAGLILASCAGGCAQLGLPTAQTFNDKVAVAYASCTQVRETATALLKAGKITADDAVNVQASADVARTGIETARKIHAQDANAANARLDAIRTGLTALAAYLASRGG